MIAELQAVNIESYKEAPPKFVAGVVMVDGSKEQLAFLDEIKGGLIVRRKGGRVDFIPMTSISYIRLDKITKDFESPKGVYTAPGVPTK